jgi:hypothetical protein
LNAKPPYAYVTVPDGGAAGAITIGESLILIVTGTVVVSGGEAESLTVTEKL